jgi:hypothetical protein
LVATHCSIVANGWVLVLVTAPALTLKRAAAYDYVVMFGNRCAGRIMLKPKAFGASVWLWTITGPYVSPTMQPSHGEADNLEDAKVSFKSKWQALSNSAAKSGLELRWVGDH